MEINSIFVSICNYINDAVSKTAFGQWVLRKSLNVWTWKAKWRDGQNIRNMCTWLIQVVKANINRGSFGGLVVTPYRLGGIVIRHIGNQTKRFVDHRKLCLSVREKLLFLCWSKTELVNSLCMPFVVCYSLQPRVPESMKECSHVCDLGRCSYAAHLPLRNMTDWL